MSLFFQSSWTMLHKIRTQPTKTFPLNSLQFMFPSSWQNKFHSSTCHCNSHMLSNPTGGSSDPHHFACQRVCEYKILYWKAWRNSQCMVQAMHLCKGAVQQWQLSWTWEFIRGFQKYLTSCVTWEKLTAKWLPSNSTLMRLLKFRPTNAHKCIRFTIILQKSLTQTCFGPDWPIIREYNNYTKWLLHISISFKM